MIWLLVWLMLLLLLTCALLLKLTDFRIVKIRLREWGSLLEMRLWDLLSDLLLKRSIFISSDEIIPSPFLRGELFGVHLSWWKMVIGFLGIHSTHNFRAWVIFWKWTRNRNVCVISISWQMLLHYLLVCLPWVSIALIEHFFNLL